MCVYVCMCMCMCVYVCVRVCARARGGGSASPHAASPRRQPVPPARREPARPPACLRVAERTEGWAVRSRIRWVPALASSMMRSVLRANIGFNTALHHVPSSQPKLGGCHKLFPSHAPSLSTKPPYSAVPERRPSRKPSRCGRALARTSRTKSRHMLCLLGRRGAAKGTHRAMGARRPVALVYCACDPTPPSHAQQHSSTAKTLPPHSRPIAPGRTPANRPRPPR